jgi:glycosyltransferase involved in cell wall biosynthesis
MRILQIAPPWFCVPPVGYGGIEQIVALLSDGLADAGHDVTLLASGGSTSRATVLSVFAEPPSADLGSTVHEMTHVMAGFARRHEFDVIHDHSGFGGAALGAFADGPPVVHTLHGPWTPTVQTYFCQAAAGLHLVGISHDQRSRAPFGVAVPDVVHNGISMTDHPFRAQADPDAYLAFVGRANAEKGPEVAVRVARRTGRHLKMAVKVNEPPEQRYWDTVVAPLLDGADVEVVANGTKQDAIDVMSGAAATLFPISWPEPFGLVMVESMAVGTPVVGYAAGASSEIVDSGRTGFLVEPGDVDGLCAALDAASELDRSVCRSHVADHFSNDAMVAGYEDVYDRLVGGRNAPVRLRRSA